MSKDEKASIDHFEVYKLAVEMADRVSTRRATANSFFVTLHTALGGLATIVAIRPSGASLDFWSTFILAISGLFLCVMWSLSIRSYRMLNEAKFLIIGELESALGLNIFRREWDLLEKKGFRIASRYVTFSSLERYSPALFLVIYVTVLMRSIV